MEKKQYDLCVEILRRFNQAGILDNFILIGSWCLYFYKEYFTGKEHVERLAIKTRDIDFLIEHPQKIQKKVENFYPTVPHPTNFALHKLIIFQRRIREEKAKKDRDMAIEVLKALIDKGESSDIKDVFNSRYRKVYSVYHCENCTLRLLPKAIFLIPAKWQHKIIIGLKKADEKNMLEAFK